LRCLGSAVQGLNVKYIVFKKSKFLLARKNRQQNTIFKVEQVKSVSCVGLAGGRERSIHFVEGRFNLGPPANPACYPQETVRAGEIEQPIRLEGDAGIQKQNSKT
jgi:hypothetical protein